MQRVRTEPHPWGTRVVLCRPERRNALDRQAVDELREAVAADGSGALVITAEGPAFCAGGDLRMLQQAADGGDLADMMSTNAAAFADLIEAIIVGPRPVIAVIDGAAIGGGASLALACDVRIATPRARLVFGWSRYGLPPDGCITATLAAAVGQDHAQALLDAGAEIGTDDELAPLVFSRVVPTERLEEETLTTVTGLADKAATREPLLSAVRRQRGAELAAIARAAADPAVMTGLAMLYKIDR
jgi:2-(1,2-epoxy-1,2-dihydrophenyl)acetyl-CoA isomerase